MSEKRPQTSRRRYDLFFVQHIIFIRFRTSISGTPIITVLIVMGTIKCLTTRDEDDRQVRLVRTLVSETCRTPSSHPQYRKCTAYENQGVLITSYTVAKLPVRGTRRLPGFVKLIFDVLLVYLKITRYFFYTDRYSVECKNVCRIKLVYGPASSENDAHMVL